MSLKIVLCGRLVGLFVCFDGPQMCGRWMNVLCFGFGYYLDQSHCGLVCVL